jgi:hypothetical protein
MWTIETSRKKDDAQCLGRRLDLFSPKDTKAFGRERGEIMDKKTNEQKIAEKLRGELLDKQFEELLKRPPDLRGDIIQKILFLELGYPDVQANDENPDHPHWECGGK